MSTPGLLQCGFYLVVLTLAARPLGHFMARVYEGQPTAISRLVGPIERGLLRLAGARAAREMHWRTYAVAMLLFNALGLLTTYGILRAQGVLPWNPQGFAGMSPHLAFNTAVSFASNTNWQSYAGEATLGYFAQMTALTVQNFVSAASGMACLVALIRALRSRQAQTIGNFWVDLVRSVVHVLLPLSVVLALFLVSQGVVQNLSPYVEARRLESVTDAEGATVTAQTLPMGPAASQIAIKQLGTNGGGFFNTNSAHPFENPTPLTNFVETVAILLVPAALCFTFGALVGDRRQGVALYVAMTILFVPLLVVGLGAEQAGNPRFDELRIDAGTGAFQAGGNMEGKETRFGIASSVLWSAATTAASNGSVNSMHDSYTPLGGFVPLFLMQMGEVVYGGVGSGLYGMLVFAFVAVFIAGLMVGRTPEYLGKKIEAFEIKMAALVILFPPLVVLLATAVAVMLPAALPSRQDGGAHGFSEILYAFSSMGNNNGSAFAGLNANVPFYDLVGGVAMLISRYWLAVPTLAIAGALARKKIVPQGLGTLPTHGPLFVLLLVGVVVMVGALTFIPALVLGPIVEHLQMAAASAS